MKANWVVRTIAVWWIPALFLLAPFRVAGQITAVAGECTPILVTVSLPKKVYRTGEWIKGTIMLTNTSRAAWYIFTPDFYLGSKFGNLILKIAGPGPGPVAASHSERDCFSCGAQPTLAQQLNEFGVRVDPGHFYGFTTELWHFERPGRCTIEVDYSGIVFPDTDVEEAKKAKHIPLQGTFRSEPIVVRIVKRSTSPGRVSSRNLGAETK